MVRDFSLKDFVNYKASKHESQMDYFITALSQGGLLCIMLDRAEKERDQL